MRALFAKCWDQVRTSFWFYPAVMSAGAVVLTQLALRVDGSRFATDLGAALGLAQEPEGARALLAVIATSMATIAGVVFSITVVVLSLASQQFGPRIIRSFMADRGVQTGLGAYVATFSYCLLVHASVGSDEAPAFSLAVALLLALLCVAELIFFIHHMAASVQAPVVIANVGRELDEAIERVLPREDEEGDEGGGDELRLELIERFRGAGTVVESATFGYVQSLDFHGLVELAREHDVQLEVRANPGAYVTKGGELVRIVGAAGKNESLVEAIRNRYALGSRRTPVQDLLFGIAQLVEIGLRALSPSLNDPYTATNAVNRLGQGLVDIAARAQPRRLIVSDEGRPLMVTYPVRRAEAVHAVFAPLRPFAIPHMQLVQRMLELCNELHERFDDESMRAAVREEARMLHDAAQDHFEHAPDRRRLADAFQSLDSERGADS